MAKHKKWNKQKVIQEIKSLEVKLRRKPMKRDSHTLYGLTRKFFGSWNNAMKKSGFEVKITQKPKIPEKINENLAYFLGLLITDGHIASNKDKGEYRTMIFNSFEEEKNKIIQLIKKLFDYNAPIRKKMYGFNKLPNYEIHINSKKLAKCLINKFKIPAGNKSRIVKVPPYFFKSRRNISLNFIRGVIDGDGSVSQNRIKIASGSEDFLKGINRVLSNYNIFSGKIIPEKSSNTFIVYISSKENFKNLYHLLYSNAEFFYSRKKECWERYLNTF